MGPERFVCLATWTACVTGVVTGVVACGAASPRLPVDVLVLPSRGGQSDLVAEGVLSTPLTGVELNRRELPALADTAPTRDTESDSALLSARRAYEETGDFEGCVATLDAGRRVPVLLSAPAPELAARVLFWTAACELAGGNETAASATATWFATLGLAVPAEGDGASVEVLALLARARAEVAAAPRSTVRFSCRGGDSGTIGLDGVPAVCRAPCSLDVAPGTHVVTCSSPGFALGSAVFESTAGDVTVALEQASPTEITRAWSLQYSQADLVESAPSLRLLSMALAAPRLLIVGRSADGPNSRVWAVLLDGDRASLRSEERDLSETSLDDSARRVTRSLLLEGRLEPSPQLFERLDFWLVVAGVVVVATVVTAVLVYEPPIVREYVWSWQ